MDQKDGLNCNLKSRVWLDRTLKVKNKLPQCMFFMKKLHIQINALIITNNTCKQPYQVVWKFLDHWFILDTSSPCITHKAEVKIESISSIFLVVYSNRKSKNFRSKQSSTKEITKYIYQCKTWKLVTTCLVPLCVFPENEVKVHGTVTLNLYSEVGSWMGYCLTWKLVTTCLFPLCMSSLKMKWRFMEQ
jgi:hypothetical protein